MDAKNLKILVQEIVKQSNILKNKHTAEKTAPVNYACIFSQNETEHRDFLEAAKGIGKIIEETPTGPLFRIQPLGTVAGLLQLLKIRAPDPTRPQRGDADFTVFDYEKFKQEHLGKEGYKLITKPKFEMIELKDPVFNVLAYFSNPPLDKQLGIN
jgi:hypothetical protein